jgi:hypothetical protein
MTDVLTAVRRQAARWIFQGQIRLGDGEDLQPIRPEDLEGIRRRFPRPKFFIFGHARSGTSYLARLIRLHPEVHCNWQTQFFSDRGPVPYLTSAGFRLWLHHPSNRWSAGWEPTAVFLRVCCDVLMEWEGERVNKRVVGDKSPNGNGAEAVRWLKAVYPDARLLYIVRDGRDTVLSKRVQLFVDQPDSLGRSDRRVRRAFLEDARPFLEQRRSVFTPAWLESAARKWAMDVDESVSAGRLLFGDRFRVVRYEDLLTDPAPALQELWGFLDVGRGESDVGAAVAAESQNNPEAEWHNASKYDFTRQLPRGVHGGWQGLYTPADAQLFERAAGRTLEAWNYHRAP